jgi:hypothetical protein
MHFNGLLHSSMFYLALLSFSFPCIVLQFRFTALVFSIISPISIQIRLSSIFHYLTPRHVFRLLETAKTNKIFLYTQINGCLHQFIFSRCTSSACTSNHGSSLSHSTDTFTKFNSFLLLPISNHGSIFSIAFHTSPLLARSTALFHITTPNTMSIPRMPFINQIQFAPALLLLVLQFQTMVLIFQSHSTIFSLFVSTFGSTARFHIRSNINSFFHPIMSIPRIPPPNSIRSCISSPCTPISNHDANFFRSHSTNSFPTYSTFGSTARF